MLFVSRQTTFLRKIVKYKQFIPARSADKFLFANSGNRDKGLLVKQTIFFFETIFFSKQFFFRTNYFFPKKSETKLTNFFFQNMHSLPRNQMDHPLQTTGLSALA